MVEGDIKMIDTNEPEKKEIRLIALGEGDMWTPFLEKINGIMLEEKKARQESDHIKGAELCCKIVSQLTCKHCRWLASSP